MIENGVLMKCTGANANVVIPSGVTSIDRYAFWGCTSLASVTLPATAHFGADVFDQTPWLESQAAELTLWQECGMGVDKL